MISKTISKAIAYNLTIITHDKSFDDYPVIIYKIYLKNSAMRGIKKAFLNIFYLFLLV